MSGAPVLRTERLVLRGWRPPDREAFAAEATSVMRAGGSGPLAGMLGAVRPEPDAVRHHTASATASSATRTSKRARAAAGTSAAASAREPAVRSNV